MLDRIRPTSSIPYITAMLNASVCQSAAATHLEPTSWQWLPHEYLECLDDKREMIASLAAIAAAEPPPTL